MQFPAVRFYITLQSTSHRLYVQVYAIPLAVERERDMYGISKVPLSCVTPPFPAGVVT